MTSTVPTWEALQRSAQSSGFNNADALLRGPNHEIGIPSLLAVLLVVIGLGGIPVSAQFEAAAKGPVQLDHKIASKLLVNQVTPEYPPIARVNYIRGQVRILITVGRSGRVSFAHVVHGHAFLAASALKAIHQWVYRPLMTASGPVDFQTRVDVNFTLRTMKADRLPPDPDQDLTRQVTPPEALDGPVDGTSADCVRMRVLVNDGGEAIDATPLAGPPSLFHAAREKIEGWKFRPARWGNFKVPWYVDVSVPTDGVVPSEEKSEALSTAPIGR
jgi:TonB family protein